MQCTSGISPTPTPVEAVNKVPEGNRLNRLSELQRGILAVLPDASGRPICSGEILKRLDAPATAATRASLSRALRRLEQRGLVYRGAGWFRPGRGYLYTRAHA